MGYSRYKCERNHLIIFRSVWKELDCLQIAKSMHKKVHDYRLGNSYVHFSLVGLAGTNVNALIGRGMGLDIVEGVSHAEVMHVRYLHSTVGFLQKDECTFMSGR